MRGKMKAAVRTTVVLGVLVVTAALALLPFWNAAALILRAAGTPGVMGRIARWHVPEVSDSIEHVPTRDGLIRARVFRPSRNGRTAVLLVSGVHPDGIDEPRLVDLATDLARTGVNVVTPEIRELMEYRLTASVTDAIEDTALWTANRIDLAAGFRIGMIGVSFSGGLSIVAAGRDTLRDRVAYVLSFGGHGNLPRVLRYLCTGEEPQTAGIRSAPRPPHDYAVAVVLHQAAELAVPADQVDLLRRGIEAFLGASASARTDQTLASELTTSARTIRAHMAEPSATLMQYVIDRDVKALGARLLPYLETLGQDPSLSPDRSRPPAAPVFLLHGRDDNVIPPGESALLEPYLQKATTVRRLESGFLSHVDVAESPKPWEIWDMIRFWKDALATQGKR
jgi:hypothetical protein